jgi:hypothetical protein
MRDLGEGRRGNCGAARTGRLCWPWSPAHHTSLSVPRLTPSAASKLPRGADVSAVDIGVWSCS